MTVTKYTWLGFTSVHSFTFIQFQKNNISKLKENLIVNSKNRNIAYGADLLGGEDRADILWDALGEEDFFLDGGEAPLEGEDTPPECSSEVTAHLALWELSERSLKSKTCLNLYNENT